MPLFRALAKNMAPMTNADESPTNRLTLFPIYLSLFIVSTLCSYPVTGQIFQNKASFFIGSRTTKIMTANEKRSFVLKNLTRNRIRACIATYEKSAKYCKVSFIYGVFKPYIDKKS